MGRNVPAPRPPASDAHQRWTRRVAWLLVGVTFPVLWVGGLVTTTKAGMAVPDWPNTYGYNLFLYPWQTWVTGPWDLFIEHGHRLLASAAGVVTIALAVLLWRDERRWMRWIGIVALAGVISQGVLGGLRVVLDERLLAMLHGTTGPLFFALTVAIVVWTSRTWRDAAPAAAERDLRPLCLVILLLVYFQLVLGALLRHMPTDVAPHTLLTVAKSHLVMAGVVSLLLVGLAWSSRNAAAPVGVRRWSKVLVGLLLLQIGLGLATWCIEYAVPMWARDLWGISSGVIVADGLLQSNIVTAHQANGSLLLAGSVVTLLLAWRAAPAPATQNASFLKTSPIGRATAS